MAAHMFEEAYKKLNAAQKQVIDTVEGPVMVIAGPGTGKTHILTLRIANILRTAAQAGPENILALTFTESAARTISKRLAALIGGDTARKVRVFTFHGFAEDILRRHPEAFPELAGSRLMGDMEQTLLWREILEREEVTHLRTPKSPFFYLPTLKALEDDLTRECISLADYRAWLAKEKTRIEADESFRYTRKGAHGNAGDLKPEGIKRLERLAKGEEAIALIETYRTLKENREVYGYTDVLRMVVDGLVHDDALRADLQEKYQYVLADEHQDANALQHALLDALAFDEHPNLFIVGDEKQAIFGFQGADSTHFSTFLELYPRTTVITLTKNYRSYQDILDTAHTLLKDLPVPAGKQEHAQLSAARGVGGSLRLLTAADPLAEREQIATLVEEALAEGVPPHEIAIITLKNATADLFALHLRARGIPTLRAGDIDIEGRPSVRFLLSLMHAVADAGDQQALRDCLLAPWWNASLAERSNFLRRVRDHELPDALITTFPDIATTIAGLQQDALTLPPLPLFSKILADTDAREYFLSSSDRLENMPLVRQLIMHLEDLARRSPNATFGELMLELAAAREHGMTSIKTSTTQREGQVTVITAHKAKGMEFERVFVTALMEREWNGKGRASLIPSPLSAAREFEEVVRLLYVALTRAKNVLTLSYPEATGEGRELPPLSFLPPGLSPVAVSTEDLPLFHDVTDAPELVRELTLSYLAHDGLSPSAFNEYLESPPTFFAKRVLRLKEPENQAIVIGTSVHAGIAAHLRTHGALEDERAAQAYAELERTIQRSLLPRNAAFDAVQAHAKKCIESFLRSDLATGNPIAVEETYAVPKMIEGTEIFIKGKVDAVFKDEKGLCLVDFKTSSNIANAQKKEFEQQIAFYDLLLRENGKNPSSALIVQIGEEGIQQHPIRLTEETRRDFALELETVLSELIHGRWRAGKSSDYDALLKLFVSN